MAAPLIGPETRASSASCSGAATTVVIWNTSHMTARKSSGPTTGAVATRSRRSLHVGAVERSDERTVAIAACTHRKRSSSSANGSSASGPSASGPSAGEPCMVPGGRSRTRAGGADWARASATARPSTATSERRRGSTATTGTPSAVCKAEGSTSMPRRAATSSIVRATTTRCGCSRIWASTYRQRARFDASTTAMTRSGRVSTGASSRSRVSSSSGDTGVRLAAPGRSSTVAGAAPGSYVHEAFATSTVVPGQLPSCWRAPLTWLNSVDLPTFALPTSATVTGADVAVRREVPGGGVAVVEEPVWQLVTGSARRAATGGWPGRGPCGTGRCPAVVPLRRCDASPTPRHPDAARAQPGAGTRGGPRSP